MDDLISRQAAIDALDEYFGRIAKLKRRGLNNGEKAISLDAVGAIKSLPTIQPRRGHWIEADVCGDTTSWECSCCHNWTGLPTGWNVKTKLWFCPKCTADMREVTE